MKYLSCFILTMVFMVSVHAGDYKVTHLDENKVFKGTTLLADMSDPRIPKVVEITKEGKLVWQVLAPKGGQNHRKFHKAIRIGEDGKNYGG